MSTKRWLSRGRIGREAAAKEWLPRALDALQVDGSELPQAAFRYLAQTGTPPSGWVAAADPVHFETRLRELRVRELHYPLSDVELAGLFADLQVALGRDKMRYEVIGSSGYLHAVSSFATADCGVSTAAGHLPDHLTPAGERAALYHGLQGEIQMYLHDHAVNVARRDARLPVIHSLWLWGGGELRTPTEISLPPLYSSDPLFAGFWRHQGAEHCLSSRWPPDGMGGVIDSRETDDVEESLQRFRRSLRKGVVGVVLFADGLSVTLSRRDLWRILRPVDSRFTEDQANG